MLHIYLEMLPTESSVLSPTVVTRIRKAFERSGGSGLLHLGASELTSTLPPSLAFGREFAHLFMTRLCAFTDLTGQWATAESPVPHTELDQLLGSMPPMLGAEYLDFDRLELLQAFAHPQILRRKRRGI